MIKPIRQANLSKAAISIENAISIEAVQKSWDHFRDPATIYGINHASIVELLKAFPKNDDLPKAWAKMRLIDASYSTNLRMRPGDFEILLRFICSKSLRFDQRVSGYDPELIEEIAEDSGTESKHLSFVSKYAVLHNTLVHRRDDYVIYDNLVRENLPRFITELDGIQITKSQLNDNYQLVCNCIDALIANNDLQGLEFPRRMLDIFLWSRE